MDKIDTVTDSLLIAARNLWLQVVKLYEMWRWEAGPGKGATELFEF